MSHRPSASPEPAVPPLGHQPALTARGETLLVPLVFVLLYFTWGFTYVVLKFALRHMGPLTQVSLRALIGALALGLLALVWRRRWPRSVRLHGQIATIGVLNVSGLAGLMAIGITTVSAGETSLLIYTQPLQVAALSALLLGERLTGRQLLGLVLGFGGLVVVLLPRIQPGAAPTWWAYAALLAGAFCWALSAVIFRRWRSQGSALASVDILWFVALQVGYGGLPLLVAAAALEGLRVSPTFEALWTILYTGLLATGAANIIWFWLLARRAATIVSAYVFLVPPVAVACGALILGEPLTVNLLVGGLITLAGIALVTRPGR